jgi:hypothetical protein
MRRILAWLCAGLALAPVGAAGATFVDAALGSVDARVVTASEIALARALGLFGFAPSAAPIGAGDVERMLDAVLVLQEAEQLDIGGKPDEAEAAWRAAGERLGGQPALERWLVEVGIGARGQRWALAAVHRAQVQRLRLRDAGRGLGGAGARSARRGRTRAGTCSAARGGRRETAGRLAARGPGADDGPAPDPRRRTDRDAVPDALRG